MSDPWFLALGGLYAIACSLVLLAVLIPVDDDDQMF